MRAFCRTSKVDLDKFPGKDKNKAQAYTMYVEDRFLFTSGVLKNLTMKL